MFQTADKDYNKKMHIIIKSGKQAGKKLAIDKDVMTIGSGLNCGLVIQDAAIGAEELMIQKSGDICTIRSLTGKGFFIFHKHFIEKILEPDDLICIDKLRLKFESPFPSVFSGDLKIKHAILSDKVLMLIAVFTGIVVILILINSMTSRVKLVKESITFRGILQKQHAEKQVYEQEDIMFKIAEARNNLRVARQLERASSINESNLAKAALRLYKNISDLESIEPRPEIYRESKEALMRITNAINEKVAYLKNNAYIAMRVGNKGKTKDLLVQIMNLVLDPTNDDYIWAKAKYISMEGK
jgi:hypothetical protein